MLGQEREHAALGHQMTNQRSTVQKLPINTLHALHEPIHPAQHHIPGRHEDYSAASQTQFLRAMSAVGANAVSAGALETLERASRGPPMRRSSPSGIYRDQTSTIFRDRAIDSSGLKTAGGVGATYSTTGVDLP